MWVFGYGSLIWKADFPFKTKLIGYIKGYKRRFYQHSVDHRGRPHRPGRVVTLIPAPAEDSVWGVAYEIYKEDEDMVTTHLDYREKTGYKKHSTMFYPVKMISGDGDNNCVRDNNEHGHLKPFELTIYIGTEDNEWYAGPAPLEEIARQILVSEGPSGTNKEYLYNLAQSMRSMAPGVDDDHLFRLEKLVRRLDENSSEEQ